MKKVYLNPSTQTLYWCCGDLCESLGAKRYGTPPGAGGNPIGNNPISKTNTSSAS